MFHVWAGDGPNISLAISCHIHPSALKHAFASGQHRPACTGDRYSDPVDGMPAVHATWACVYYPRRHPLSLMLRVVFSS